MRLYLLNAHSIKKRSPISVFHVFPVWISKAKDYYLLATLYRRHGGTPLRHLIKTYAYNDPRQSKIIRTRSGHYQYIMHEAGNLFVLYMGILFINTVDMICTSRNTFSMSLLSFQNKHLQHMINPCFPLRRAFTLLLC